MRRIKFREPLAEQIKRCCLLLLLLWSSLSPVHAAALADDWQYQLESGEDCRLSTMLQADCPERDTLMFMTTNQAVRIWFKGELLYERGSFAPVRFDEGAVLHVVNLPEFQGPEPLLVELYGNSQHNPGFFNMFFLDSELEQIKRLYYFDIPVILALPVAFIILVIMAVYQYFYFHGVKRLYGFISLFMLAFFGWLISVSYFKYILLDNPAFWWYCAGILAYLLPVSSYLILAELLRNKPYAHMKWIVRAALLLFLAAMTGELAGFHTMNGLMALYYPLMGIGSLAAMVWVLKAARQGDYLCRAVLLPTCMFTVFGVFDGLTGHFHLLPWRTFITPLAVYGFAFFVIEIMRGQLRQRQMLERRTAGLEQKAALARRRSDIDALTGCFNRNRLKSLLAAGIARVQLSGGVLALLMLDIDHFKQVNDTYGHKTGDAVLMAFSKVVQSELGQYSHCIRWGGEEFMVVVNATDRDEVLALAEKIRRRIGQTEIAGKWITCSIGIAVWQEAGDRPEALFKRADTALYQAKNSGRNRVCLTDGESVN